MHNLCTHGQHLLVEMMFNRGAELNVKDRYNVTPIMCAAYNDHWHVVRSVSCRDKVEINTINMWDKKSLLHILASSTIELNAEQLNTIVHKCKALVNVQCSNGDTPLHIAVRNIKPLNIDVLLGE